MAENRNCIATKECAFTPCSDKERQRVDVSKFYYGKIATLSWIHPDAGLPEKDPGPPPLRLSTFEVQNGDICRFAHILSAVVIVENGKIISARFEGDSTIYSRNTFDVFVPETYATIRETPAIAADGKSARFTQTVGSRTSAPEKIGGTMGEAAGAVVGTAAGAMSRNAPVAVVFGNTGREIGRKLGVQLAEEVLVFPPIWSKLELVISSDGSYSGRLLDRSLFPSLSLYNCKKPDLPITPIEYVKVFEYNGIPNYHNWMHKGWGTGNPWNVPLPGHRSLHLIGDGIQWSKDEIEKAAKRTRDEIEKATNKLKERPPD